MRRDVAIGEFKGNEDEEDEQKRKLNMKRVKRYKFIKKEILKIKNCLLSARRSLVYWAH